MKTDCVYLAKVKLIDKESFKKDWEQEGNADEVLMSALQFISKKDQGNVTSKIIDYISKDWKEFDRKMTEVIFGKND